MNQRPCSCESCSSSSLPSSSSSMSSSFRPSKLIQPASPYEFGYPAPPFHSESSPLAYNKVSTPTSYSYSRFGNNDDQAQEIGWDRGDFESKDSRPYMIRWKSGKKVDQRLLMLLESYYQEVYVKRRDFFKKIFPGNHDEFSAVFSKMEDMFSKNNDEVNFRTLQRSLSFGSPRRPQRFKVKTPAVVIGNLDGRKSETAGTATTASRYGK